MAPRADRPAARRCGPSHVWRADLRAVGDARRRAAERRRARARRSDRRATRDARAVAPLARRAAGRCSGAICTRARASIAARRRRRTASPSWPPTARPAAAAVLQPVALRASRAVCVQRRAGRSASTCRPRAASSARSEAADHVALARRAFGEPEAQRLSLRRARIARRRVPAPWTRHEAELKRRAGIAASASARDAGGDAAAGVDPLSAP